MSKLTLSEYTEAEVRSPAILEPKGECRDV